MKKHYRHENDCLNCGAALQGKFCHNCGQENLQINEGFGHMMTHAVSDYFHFDHQFFHTLKPLFFKPGFLTVEYMAGRRMQYLHPVKMYIFVSVVFFLLYFRDGNKFVEVNTDTKKANTEQVINSVNTAIARDKNLGSIQKQKIQEKLKKHGITIQRGRYKGSDNTDESNFNPLSMISTGDTTYAQYKANQNKLPAANRDDFFKAAWNKKVFDYASKYGSRSREVFFDEFKHNVPKMMFILLPIFALILKVAFSKSHKFYVEHLICSFHLHCFLFLFLAIIMLIETTFPVLWLAGILNAIAFFIILWYLYRSLRVIYQRSRFRTLTKLAGISFVYFLSTIVCVVFVVFITAVTAA